MKDFFAKNVYTFMIISYIFMVGINLLSLIFPINGNTTAEVSDMYRTYFVPAGYVFLIWTVIYITQGALLLEMVQYKDKYKKIIHTFGFWFIIGNIVNGIWLFLWHYEMILFTVPLMIFLLTSLIVQYSVLYSNKAETWVKAVTGLYLGWVSVATIANISAALYAINWTGGGINPQLWSAFMILVASLLAIAMIVQCREYTYAAVIIWAIIGIWVKFPFVLPIGYAVVAGSGLIFITAIVIIVQSRLQLDGKKKKRRA